MQANALVNCVIGIHPHTQCVHSMSWGGAVSLRVSHFPVVFDALKHTHIQLQMIKAELILKTLMLAGLCHNNASLRIC